MKKFARILVSILYIIWGISALISLWPDLIELYVAAILSAAVSVIMLLAGIFGLFGIQTAKRRVFGVIILVLALFSVVTSLQNGYLWQPIVSALLAFLYIIG